LSYWDTFVRLQPDLVILGGDNVYGGDNNLATLKDAYAQLSQNSSFQRAVTSFPILATLDDNDYGNGGDACEANPHKEAAKRMFLEFFRVPKDDPRWSTNRGAYTSYQWEDQLQIILLDLRFHKSPFLNSDGARKCHVPDHSDTSKTMLGVDQWYWLEKELKKPSLVRLVVSPLQVLADGHGFECWNMLPHERHRLLTLLHASSSSSGSTTTMVLSGDRHASALYKQESLVEVTASSLTHTIGSGMLDNEMDSFRIGDFVYLNNFCRILLDWDSKSILLSIHHADTGAVIEHWNLSMQK
jgi:alkaline phosphatase D